MIFKLIYVNLNYPYYMPDIIWSVSQKVPAGARRRSPVGREANFVTSVPFGCRSSDRISNLSDDISYTYLQFVKNIVL